MTDNVSRNNTTFVCLHANLSEDFNEDGQEMGGGGARTENDHI